MPPSHDELWGRALELLPDAEGACGALRGAAPPARRHAARLPRRGAFPHPAAQARGRRGARIRHHRDIRRAARARLRLHGVELGQLRRAPHDARHVPAARAGRDLGPVARRADRLVVRLPGGEGAQGEGRLRDQRALAVLERRRSERMEHARGPRLARRERAARAARFPAGALAVQGHRYLVRRRAARHRQQGRRGDRAVRARAPDARGRRHQGRADAGQRRQSGRALPDAGVRAFPLHALRRGPGHRRGHDR